MAPALDLSLLVNLEGAARSSGPTSAWEDYAESPGRGHRDPGLVLMCL